MPKIYEELSQNAVDALHQRFLKRIAERAEKTVPDDVENRDYFVEKVNAILLMKNRLRESVSQAQLQAMIYDAPQELDDMLAEGKAALSHDYWAHRREEIDSQYAQRRESLLVDKAFAGRERIYVKLNCENEVSSVQEEIARYLERKKYKITDYKKGYATDAQGKQCFKIGKLLKNHYLYQGFIKDETRTGQNKYIVFSKAQKDLELMSTARAWSSCMSSDGVFDEKVPPIIGSQTIIAYCISENDPEINDPLGRILLKPYHRLKAAHFDSKAYVEAHGVKSVDLGHVFNYFAVKAFRGGYEPKDYSTVLKAGTCYGLSSNLFKDAVDAFAAEHFNKPRLGVYHFDSNIYADGHGCRLKADIRGRVKELYW